LPAPNGRPRPPPAHRGPYRTLKPRTAPRGLSHLPHKPNSPWPLPSGTVSQYIRLLYANNDPNLFRSYVHCLELSTAFKLLSADTFWLSYILIATKLYRDKSVFHPEMTHSSQISRRRFISDLHRNAFRFHCDRKMFTVLNTHLDDQSDGQRRLAASMLLTRARYEAVNTSGPVFIIGDFNSASPSVPLQQPTKKLIPALPQARIPAHTASPLVPLRPHPSTRPLQTSTPCKIANF
jgi:hypothetical protein